MLAWGMSDATGNFALTIADTLYPVEIRTRFLGYGNDTLTLRDVPRAPLTIALAPGKNALPSTTVRARRPPVTRQSDTTVYNLADFRDSTDRKIEDVLRKLPGVDVGAGGDISVNGKPLYRLLVEGSDLFGQDYQLGSKNVNARDIGQVRIVNHYEDNAVLRTVNDSENVVLDLRLEERVKAVLAGNVLAGGGYGGEAKYKFYGSLYRITRRHKTISITDVDNVATAVGFSDIGSSSDGSGNDIRAAALSPADLFSSPAINTAGISPRYTDNTNLGFQTFRHESNFNERWRLQANATYRGAGARQQLTDTQTFLEDESIYRLRTERAWETTDRYGEGEVVLRYLAPSQSSSLEIYASANRLRQDIRQRFTVGEDTLPYDQSPLTGSGTFRAVFNRELSAGLVTQIEFTYGGTRQNQSSDRLYPSLDSFATLNGFATDYQFTQRSIEGKNRWLYRTGNFLLSGEVGYRSFDASAAGADYQRYRSAVGLRWTPSGQLTLRSNLRLNYYTRAGEALRNDLLPGLTISANYRRNVANTYSISLYSGQRLPPLERRLTELNYVYDAFQLITPGPAYQIGTYRRLSGTYNWRNDAALRYFSVRLRYVEENNAPNFLGRFAGPLTITSWVYGLDRKRATATVTFSQFLLPIKSDLKITARTGRGVRSVVVEGRGVDFNVWSYGLSGRSGLAIRRRWRWNYSLAGDWQNFRGRVGTYSTVRGESDLTYRGKSLQAFTGLTATWYGGPKGRQYADGVYLGAKRTVNLADERQLEVDLRVYNPFGRRVYENQTVGDNFLFTSSVPALRPFGVLTVDFSL